MALPLLFPVYRELLATVRNKKVLKQSWESHQFWAGEIFLRIINVYSAINQVCLLPFAVKTKPGLAFSFS
ncbi:MAG: hypothetical protein ACLQED_10385 [Desulfobaccales bacterium]